MREAAGEAIVAVDGPAGSGKSTLGRRLATALRLPLIDTGLFYRAVTLAAARARARPEDEALLADIARRTRIDIGTHPDAQPDVRVDGIAVSSDDLHDPRHAALLSAVSGGRARHRHRKTRHRRDGGAGAPAVRRTRLDTAMIYVVMRGAVRVIAAVVLGRRLHIEGLEHVPRRGAALVVGNHVGAIDG